MGQVVELEVAADAINPGSSVSVGTSSTPIAEANRRTCLVLGNGSDQTIWIRLAADGASVGVGIPIFSNSGLVLRTYGGAVSAACTSGGKSLGVAEY